MEIYHSIMYGIFVKQSNYQGTDHEFLSGTGWKNLRAKTSHVGQPCRPLLQNLAIYAHYFQNRGQSILFQLNEPCREYFIWLMNFATLTLVLLSISFEDLTTEIQLSNQQSSGIYSDICLISSTGIQLAVRIAEIFIV